MLDEKAREKNRRRFEEWLCAAPEADKDLYNVTQDIDSKGDNKMQASIKVRIWLIVVALILIIVLVIANVLLLSSRQTELPEPNVYPEGVNAIVTDGDTATSIAEAILLPIYGEIIYDQRPFVAEYDDLLKVWHVWGSLPTDSVGGVAEVVINGKDGMILSILHTV